MAAEDDSARPLTVIESSLEKVRDSTAFSWFVDAGEADQAEATWARMPKAAGSSVPMVRLRCEELLDHAMLRMGKGTATEHDF